MWGFICTVTVTTVSVVSYLSKFFLNRYATPKVTHGERSWLLSCTGVHAYGLRHTLASYPSKRCKQRPFPTPCKQGDTLFCFFRDCILFNFQGTRTTNTLASFSAHFIYHLPAGF